MKRTALSKYVKLSFLIVFGLIVFLENNRVFADNVSYTGHNSWHQLTTSNGICAGIYSQSQGKLIRFQHHIFSHEKEGSTTPNYMYDAYFGYRDNQDDPVWLDQLPVKNAEYINGTNIIHSVQTNNDLTFDSYYFTPFSGTDDGSSSLIYMILKVTNNGFSNHQLSVFSQENMHMGTDYGIKNEQTSYNADNDYIKEDNASNDSYAIYKNLVSQNESYQTGNGANGPRNFLNENSNLDNQVQPKGDDLVAGFENKDITLSSGQSKWFGVVIGLREYGDDSELSQVIDQNAQTALQGSPETILQQEENWWQNWHSTEKMPSGLTEQEQETYKQSTAVLKMSQVREKIEGYGQVLASLIPGEWSTSWVRDGSYSIKALIESGHYQEAKEALTFFLNASMRKNADGENYYQKNYIENSDQKAPTYGLNTKLSSNYLLSICRYYGDGVEESDYNDNGPNIEFDGWGLFLWVLGDYIKETKDYSFLSENWDKITEQDADLLLELVNNDNGLIQPDSSIWEEHWTPYSVLQNSPARQQFAFTDITAWAGLEATANMAKDISKDSDYQKYSTAADNLKEAIMKNLVVDEDGYQTIASSIEKKGDSSKENDGATVEAINTGLISADSNLAEGMINSYNKHLRITTGNTPGYMRNQDGDLYDSREWAFIDLRIAGALSKMGQKNEAKTLIDWMTSQAQANYNLIPELLDYTTQDYAGSVPMGGFGSGSYILAINGYFDNDVDK